MADNLNAGDLVQLKSGGPKMTIERLMPSGDSFKCTWFSGNKHNTEVFRKDALVPFVEESK